MNYHKISISFFFILLFIQALNAQELAGNFKKIELGLKGKVKEFTEDEGQDMRSQYKFDIDGKLIEYFFSKTTTDKYNRTTIYTYDVESNLLFSERHSPGRGTVKETFKNGKIILFENIGKKGVLLTSIKYNYDSLNNLIKKERYLSYDESVDIEEYKIKYNKNNQIIRLETIQIIDTQKIITNIETYKYDAAGERKEVTKYSNHIDKDSPPKISSKLIFTIDSLGNKLRKYYKYNADGEISSSEFNTSYQTPEGKRTKTLSRYYMGSVHTISTSKYNKYDNLIFYSLSESENKEYYRAEAAERNYQSRVKPNFKRKESTIETTTIMTDSELENQIKYIPTDKMLVIIEDKFEYIYDYQGNWVKKIKYSKTIKNNNIVEKSEENRIITYY